MTIIFTLYGGQLIQKKLIDFWEMMHLPFFGWYSKILCKNREKLENICSTYIWRLNGVRICTGVILWRIKAKMPGSICPK